MSKHFLLSLSLSFLILFNGCLARRDEQQQYQNECQLDRLDALEPDNRIESEAGVIESWNPNHDQFRCAGVAISRFTIEQNGLFLPSFRNAPSLMFVVQGRGIQGTMIPGCPETFQESQESQQGQQSHRFQDQHQKIRRFREGDIMAMPAGVAHWCYNDGNSPLVVVALLDTSNNDNQLDQNPRSFYLAGNPEQEFQQDGQQQQEYQHERRRGQRQQQQHHGMRGQQQCNNIFCGFEPQVLADAFNVEVNTVRKLQNENDNRGNIVRVRGDGLQVVSPPRMQEEEEREQRQRRGRDNGVEETLCTMRLRENIGDPERADVFTPQAGRISTLNSNNLPVLRWLQLSAERGVLYSNGVMVPHWNLNAHSIIYVIRGSARVQVVDNYGQNVFDERMRRGQVLTVPQNYAIVKRAENEGFDWIAFKTNDNAMTSPLSGKTSAIRAMPEDVLVNAFQISREEARRLKFNMREATLTSAGSMSERRAEA